MKKYLISATLLLSSGAFIVTTTQSCTALASSSVGLTILKQILLGGISKGVSIFSDKNSFLANQLIDAAMPQKLKDVNSTLEKLGLSNLVAKEKDYIAQAASFTVTTAQPILENAVNNLTPEDAAKIAQGGTGAATQLLKERTATQLMAAISPKVESKLNEFGIVKTLNTALAGSNMLGSLLGGSSSSSSSLTGGLSKFASEQMVNGLFAIIQNSETNNASKIMGALGVK